MMAFCYVETRSMNASEKVNGNHSQEMSEFADRLNRQGNF